MAFTISIGGESKWKFKTFGTMGASVGDGPAAGISSGLITLSDPEGKATDLYYGGIGVGLAGGFKFKLGKIKIATPKVSPNIAPTWFDSTGDVFVTSNCPGQDLKRNDFSGICAFVEVGGGIGVGYSGVALLAGMQGTTNFWENLAGSMVPGALLYFMLTSARALIRMRGWNVGAQLGGGGIAYVGFMS
jgi:hypothetical protein